VRLRAFRVPQLDGIVAPVVTLQVSDLARFKRWYSPGCTEGWLLGPRADANGSPYFGLFLSVIDASGKWIYSEAATPNEGGFDGSALKAKLFPPRPTRGVAGVSACPHRFSRG
jgi:hypothetical protein